MKVFIDVHDERWGKYNIDFNKIVCATDSGVYKNSEVSIILTDDAEIHEINKTYRNVDKPTNVLSFELGDEVLLGDIYISYDTVMREAEELKIPFENHVAHMVVHGCYHLMGYDHITDDEAAVMEMKEIKALKKLGIKNPYADNEDFVCSDALCCPGGRFLSFFKRIRIRENGWVQYALYALFAGVAVFGFAPFYCWWATLIGVAGAYWLTVRNKNIGGFWRTLLRVSPFGAVYAIGMFWWMLHSIYVVPELIQQFAIWTVPALIGLGIAGVLIFSWPFVAVARVRTSAAARVFLFAGVWTFVLWAREWLFTGFPWNPLANITMPWPMLANSMSLWGALGLTFVLAGGIASFVEGLRHRKLWSCWLVLGIFISLIGVGIWYGNKNISRADVGADSASVVIRVVQPAQSQVKKATHSREQALQNAQNNLKKLIDLSGDVSEVDIVVFPETTYPFAIVDGDNFDFSRVIGRDVVIGANVIDNVGQVYNSMIIANKLGDITNFYSKTHLVPFGEYRPLGFMPAPVNLARGGGAKVINVNGFSFVPAICYEIIFSDSLIPNSTENIDAIINITNDNWFGNTPGTYQHLDMVRRYAIESGLPIVRANYSGISAFVASDGEVVSQLPIGVSGTLDGVVWGAHETPYRMIGRDGWMIIILLFATACAVIFARRD